MTKCNSCKQKIREWEKIYKNWLYNFCSKEHRQEFINKQLEKQKKKKLKERQEIKKQKKREKKQNSIPRLIKELDLVFSKYVRIRDALKTTWTLTHLKCYTCDDLVEVWKAQNMHFIPRWFKQFRFSEDNTRGWCMRCNVLMHWNYIEYFTRLEKEIWRQKIDDMIQRKNEVKKFTSEELKELIKIYKNKLNFFK